MSASKVLCQCQLLRCRQERTSKRLSPCSAALAPDLRQPALPRQDPPPSKQRSRHARLPHCPALAVGSEEDAYGTPLPPKLQSKAQPKVDQPPAGGLDFFNWLLDLPWQRVGAWLLVALFAAQLKDFFGIAMGTFVLAFVGNGFVRSTERSALFRFAAPPGPWRRRLLVLVYFTAIVSLVMLFGVMTIPDILREATDFVRRLQNENIWVVVLNKMRSGVGDGVMDQVERLLLVAAGDDSLGILASVHEPQAWTIERSQHLGMVMQKMLRGYTEAAVQVTSGLVTFISKFAIQVGVSLILSFMVVWDLPTIADGVASLETSRMAPIYREVAPSFGVFGRLFGKALQAQSQIAMVNAALTALGMWLLQIPGVGLLSLFVFICSFIPVAGCFISTVPIGFVALTEYGFLKLALVIVMVTVVHLVEAYALNPAIYSAHLKLHPLLVLTVLVVAEHSLGIWGLMLAVPLTVFALDYCIRYPACSVTDVAAMELSNVSSSIDNGAGDSALRSQFGVEAERERRQRKAQRRPSPPAQQ